MIWQFIMNNILPRIFNLPSPLQPHIHFYLTVEYYFKG